MNNTENWVEANVNIGEYESPPSEYSSRNVYSAHLTDLKPDKIYIFSIEEESWLKHPNQKLYSYQTFGSRPIKILAAGDVGNKEASIEMGINTVKNLNVDLMIFGGDLAYDNNIPTCYNAWDYFLRTIQQNVEDPVTKTTRIIPMILGVGNHDVGVQSFTFATVPLTPHSPVFMHWFPQNTANNLVPALKDRKTYFSHKFGDKLHIISLDAEYLENMEGNQTEWLRETLSNSKSEIKIVQFHGPIYGS